HVCNYAFFFSSRRRHTRSDRDWSSDVCSSDLEDAGEIFGSDAATGVADRQQGVTPRLHGFMMQGVAFIQKNIASLNDELATLRRSEERRVGKEWRSRRSP